MSDDQWVWKGPRFQRAMAIAVPLAAAVTMLSMLIWTLTDTTLGPERVAPAATIAAVGAVGFFVVFVRSMSVAAVATRTSLTLRGVWRRRVFSWAEIEGFSICSFAVGLRGFRARDAVPLRSPIAEAPLSGPSQGVGIFVELRSGDRHLIPSQLQYKFRGGRERLYLRLVQVRADALACRPLASEDTA